MATSLAARATACTNVGSLSSVQCLARGPRALLGSAASAARTTQPFTVLAHGLSSRASTRKLSQSALAAVEAEMAHTEDELPAAAAALEDALRLDQEEGEGEEVVEEEGEEEESYMDGMESRTFASLFSASDTETTPEEIAEELMLANCGLSAVTVRALEARGIFSLFPIQKVVYEPAMAGSDMIARAKTGSGKTLAFALPVIEKILADRATGRRPERRLPACLVLAPTRELAKQVEREMQATAPSLLTGCYYGGTPIGPQLRELRKGVDICVGTPGRIIDLIDQDSLDLSEVRFVILDEADQMLNVGFEKDVETILENVPKERQTMLFSATVPKWVQKLCRTYLNNPVNIDTVGEGQTGKMADSITALAVQVTDESRRSVLVDVLTVHAAGGKAIVFTQTKREADEVAASVSAHLPCSALHGDMGQREREKVLSNFRENKLTVLVATDVAARGLDIPDVDLVVHYELPQDPEGFLHRSGRTGRAGRSGTAIAMFTRREIGYFKRILRETETSNVTLVSPPSPMEVIEAAAKQVMHRLDGVDAEVKSFFTPVAKMVLSSRNPQDAMEAALAALSGIKEIPEPRSLITHEQGWQTLQMVSKAGRITRPAHISAIVGRLLPDSPETVNKIGRIRMLEPKDGEEGAAFDLPTALGQELMAQAEELEKRGVSLTMPSTLPPEEDLYSAPRGGGSRMGGRGGGRGGSRGYNDDSDFFERRRQSQSGGSGGRGGGGRGGGGGGRFGGDRFGDRRSSGGGGGRFGGGGRGGGGGSRYGDSGRSFGGRDSGRDSGRDARRSSGGGGGSGGSWFEGAGRAPRSGGAGAGGSSSGRGWDFDN